MRCIPWLPELLPDELLYSWLARLIALNALGPPKSSLEQLFSDRHVVPSVDFAARLQKLFAALDMDYSNVAMQALVDSSTQYPFHRPFLDERRHQLCLAQMTYGSVKGLNTVIGRLANGFGAAPALRYCPACLEKCWQEHGQVIWQRSHNLPGVQSCHVHETRLERFVQPSKESNRHRLWLPPLRVVQPNTSAVVAPSVLAFDQLANDLLIANLPVVAPHVRSAVYRQGAAQKGMFGTNGRLQWHRLNEAVSAHYRGFDGFEHRARLLSPRPDAMDWIRVAIQKPARCIHPICHVLLIGYFFGSIDAFKVEVARHTHGRDDVPECFRDDDMALTPQVNDTRRAELLADTSISCRKVAAQLGQATNTVVSQRRALGLPISERRQRVTDDMLDKTVRLFSKPRMTIEKAAKELGVSASTVSRLKVQVTSRLPERPTEQERNRRRLQWQGAMNRCDGSVKGARQCASATYAWLYRHVKEWLMQREPKAYVRTKVGSRIDWATWDAKVSADVGKRAQALTQDAYAPRISRTCLIRPHGERRVLKNLHRLPLTVAALQQHVENTATFQRRRIRRVVELLAAGNRTTQPWKVVRMARIRSSAALRRYASEIISHHT